MEEFSQLLGVPILNQPPFNSMERDPKPEEIAQALSLQWSDVVENLETRRSVQGFLANFLFEKVFHLWDSLDLQAFEEVLALLIYGMVLLPNTDQLIDVNVIKIFMSRNSVPTLLGDILHSFHTLNMRKRGILMCCTPLLARCFISHLPQSVLKNEQGLRWSHRLMTLRHSDVHWCS